MAYGLKASSCHPLNFTSVDFFFKGDGHSGTLSGCLTVEEQGLDGGIPLYLSLQHAQLLP